MIPSWIPITKPRSKPVIAPFLFKNSFKYERIESKRHTVTMIINSKKLINEFTEGENINFTPLILLHMKDARRASKTFNSIASHFDKTRNRPWGEVVKFIESCEGNLLDIGCGNGRHIIVALKNGLDVVGIDVSNNLLSILDKKLSNKGLSSVEVDLVRGRFKALPFTEEHFENIIFIAGLHHLSGGRVKALKEAKRVLKKGGKILISVWAREQDRWDLNKEEKEVTVPWTKENGEVVDRYYHLYALDELIGDFKKSGMKINKAYQKKGNHYIKGYKV